MNVGSTPYYLENDPSVSGSASPFSASPLLSESSSFEDPFLNDSSIKAPAFSACSLITLFWESWNPVTNNFENLDFTVDHFLSIIKEYNNEFPCLYDCAKEYGCILKKDLPPNTKIFIRADLHGDLLSLLINLNTLITIKSLDKKYRCREGVQLVFLGDYGDRGEFSLEIIALLACLKKENPDQVFLMRGNHEDLIMNRQNCSTKDINFRTLLDNEEYSKDLDRFYSTLLLSLYFAQTSPTGENQYVQFSHGAVDLKFDPYDLLHHPEPIVKCVVPFNLTLSERIKQIPFTKDFDYKHLIANTINKKERKQLKQEWAAMRITELTMQEIERTLSNKILITPYTWGDLDDESTKLGDLTSREWKLSTEDLKHYQRLTGNTKFLFHGHQHFYHRWRYNGKIVAMTVPVAMESLYKRYIDQDDIFIMVKTSEKAKDWLLTHYSRTPGADNTKIYPECTLFSPKGKKTT